ncbi:MAG: phage major capsid protein [Bacillota bacterium]
MFEILLKAKLAEQEALVKAAIEANRAMTDDEQTKFNALQAEIDGLEKSIEAAAKLEKQQAKMNTPANQPIYAQPKKPEEQSKFATLGEQLMAAVEAARPGGSLDPRLMRGAASGLSESVPSDGGFLVEQDFVTELLKRTYETGVLGSRCRRIPISATANGLKINAIDETSRADGSRWGGVQAYWENEADMATATKPKFRKMELSLKKLMGLCYATDELLQDARALESVISDAFAEEFGFKIDDAILNGTGAGQPLGIMNSGVLVTVPKETGQAAATIVYENIVKMWARLWARSRQNAVWYINQDIEPQLFRMSLAVGTGGVPVYLPAGGLSQSPYGTLFGRPVISIEHAATLGAAGDILLCDLSQYLLIDKGGINAASSIHVRFLYDESVFRFIYRADGQPIWNSALTPFKGAAAQSPFIALATRA